MLNLSFHDTACSKAMFSYQKHVTFKHKICTPVTFVACPAMLTIVYYNKHSFHHLSICNWITDALIFSYFQILFTSNNLTKYFFSFKLRCPANITLLGSVSLSCYTEFWSLTSPQEWPLTNSSCLAKSECWEQWMAGKGAVHIQRLLKRCKSLIAWDNFERWLQLQSFLWG